MTWLDIDRWFAAHNDRGSIGCACDLKRSKDIGTLTSGATRNDVKLSYDRNQVPLVVSFYLTGVT
jgi:hypothetical protein